MVDPILHILDKAKTWDQSIVVAGWDIRTAFDSMGHGDMAWALNDAKVSKHLTAAFLRELFDLEASVDMGEVRIDGMSYSKGGRQGGTETPFIWNRRLDACVFPMAQEWERRGYGVVLKEGAPRLTHLIWADNIW